MSATCWSAPASRSSRPRSRAAALGLGLFLARGVLGAVRRHPRVTSGDGTTVTLELPRRRTRRRSRDRDAASNGTAARLLIVDDDVPFRARLMRAFAERDSTRRARAATTKRSPRPGPRARAGPRRSPPARRVRTRARPRRSSPSTPPRSSWCSPATAASPRRSRACRLGATSYLTKPVDADQIVAAFDGSAGHAPRAVPWPSLARVEWEHIQRVLADCDGNVSQAARLLRFTGDRCSGSSRSIPYDPNRLSRSDNPHARGGGCRLAHCVPCIGSTATHAQDRRHPAPVLLVDHERCRHSAGLRSAARSCRAKSTPATISRALTTSRSSSISTRSSSTASATTISSCR